MNWASLDFSDLQHGVDTIINERTAAAVQMLAKDLEGVKGSDQLLLLAIRHEAFGGLGDELRKEFADFAATHAGRSAATGVLKAVKEKQKSDGAKPPGERRPDRGRPRKAAHMVLAGDFAALRGSPRYKDFSDDHLAKKVGAKHDVSKDTVLRAIKKHLT